MTEHEKVMYEILACLSNSNSPLVFKGALITRLILEENNFYDVSRQTKDIDVNWVGDPPSMEILTRTIGFVKQNSMESRTNFDVLKPICADVCTKADCFGLFSFKEKCLTM
ncbi:MAG: hypothetical protein LUE12_03535 [Ruminococcus sp.]|nr:hypothetical protein [Ruminococcus sp.]